MRRLVFLTGVSSLAVILGVSAQSGLWTLAPSESRVLFHFSYEGEAFVGEFKNVEATFDINPANPGACNINVSIPIADISVDSSEIHGYLMDEDMFNVEKFPMAAFHASKCTLQSANSFVAEGQLTIRDQTHPLSFPFTFDMEMSDGQPRFHLTSDVTVKRLDYGVGTGWWEDEEALPNEVRIEVDVYSGP